MYESMVNYWAVIVSALVFFGIGSLWYGPLFSKQWMKAVGITQEDLESGKMETNMAMSFSIMFVSSLFMAAGVAHLIDYMLVVFPDSSPVRIGLTTGFFAWFSFILAYLLTAPAFENRPWAYVLINGGYWLLGTLSTGLIVGLWR